MAYISAAYTSNWAYEKGGSDYNAKLGALLANGADLQASSCVQLHHAPAATAAAAAAATQPHSGNVNDNPYKSSAPAAPWVGPRPGFAWVDEHGTPLAIGPPATASLEGGSLRPLAAQASAPKRSLNSIQGSTCHASSVGSNSSNSSGSSQKAPDYAAVTASQRSMALWERVSPGMMPGTTRTPAATTAAAYVWQAALLEPVDTTHHLRKTDFAEFIECKLRLMHHIAAAAKK